MMPNVAMLHEVDPKTEILNKLGKSLDGFEILNNEVLLAIYMRPKQTAIGRIIMPDSALKEDKYQGKVGLVVKVGPSCEFPTPAKSPVALHDWVLIKASDSLSMDILTDKGEEVPCRLVMDKYIRVKISRPDIAW
jgi:hypothetical protein